mgnify:CR=1 FL=1
MSYEKRPTISRKLFYNVEKCNDFIKLHNLYNNSPQRVRDCAFLLNYDCMCDAKKKCE